MMRVAAELPTQLPLWAATAVEKPQPPVVAVEALQSLEDLRDRASIMRRLQAVDWSFTDDKTGYFGHDIHPYPAKFIPQIPANLIAALSRPGELVWDPFGGSGTTALEALLSGRRAASTDANPLSQLITRVKCTALSPEERQELQLLHERLSALADGNRASKQIESLLPSICHLAPEIPNLHSWYAPHVVNALCYVKDEILDLESAAARDFAFIVFSSILIRVSFQDSETRYARAERETTTEQVLRMYCRALGEAVRSHEPLERLLGYRSAVIATVDMRTQAEQLRDLVPPQSVELVVTSPPYANATDYHLYHRFRLFWLGFDPTQLAQCEIGSHLRHQRLRAGFDLYRSEMRQALSIVHEKLRPGRYAAFVVGDSVFEGKTIGTAAALGEEAKDIGFEVVGVISRPVHATRRSFIPAARRTRSEDILLLRTKPGPIRVLFCGTSYRMWPYEERLQLMEIEGIAAIKPKAKGKRFVATLDPYEVDGLQRLAFTHRVEGEQGTPSWVTWQAILENGDATTARKNPKYLTHGIHAYKGKFYPQLAKALFNVAGLRPAARVLDPFCGSGTVLLEAQLNGLTGAGCDMHPLAVLISRAKTAVVGESDVLLDRTLKIFSDGLKSDRSSSKDLDTFDGKVREEILSWFPRRVAERIGWLLPQIRRVPSESGRLVLECLLSSIIREVSQQEPADLRIRRRKLPLKDGPVLSLLADRIAQFRERLQHFARRRSWAPARFGNVDIREGDSRDVAVLQSLASEPFDAVVTSPPYATALPYIDTDRLSLLVLFGIAGTERTRLEMSLTGSREIRDQERRALEARIMSRPLGDELGSDLAARIVQRVFTLNRDGDVGFRRRNMGALLYRYFVDMLAVFQNLSRVVRPGGDLFFVIGDNKTSAGGHNIDIRSGDVLVEMAEGLRWDCLPAVPITVTKEAVLHSQNSITANTILHFRTSTSKAGDRGKR